MKRATGDLVADLLNRLAASGLFPREDVQMFHDEKTGTVKLLVETRIPTGQFATADGRKP